MSEKYLSDRELEEVADHYALRDTERLIADAASDKAYAAGESEREALRAEVERLRRVIDEIAPMIPCHDCPGGWGVDRPTDPCPPHGESCAERVINEVSKWALSEAGKEEGC